MDEKKINSNVNKSYSIGYSSNSSYLTGGTIQTSVPYAASQANNFSTKVDEMDLNLSSDVEVIENSTSEWLSSAEEFLEQLRKLNEEEIERLEIETESLETKYQDYLSNLHLNLEREELIKNLQNQLQVLHMNAQFISGLGQEDEINRLTQQIEPLKKEELEEKIQYIKEHSNEFESFMGMGFEEYNQKIAYNEYTILELKAKDYQLRQQAKELPYLEIMSTEEFLNYISSHNEASNQSISYLENRNLENYLTEEQIMMFSYLYDTKGWNEAAKYLEAIEDKINQAKGMAEAQVFLSRITDEEGNVDVGELEYILATMGQGLLNGVETFGEGFENLFDINSDGMVTDNQYAQQFILQGLSELQEKGQISKFIDDTYQISTSIGNMLPGSIISMLTCGTFGQVLMGMSAAGNAKNDALVSMSDNKTLAYLYGAFNGMSEAVIGKMFGNIPGLNEGAKFAVNEILSEGFEELAQTYLDAGLKLVVYHEVPDLGELTEEAFRSFLYGCITSGLMTGSQAAINFTINGVKHSYNNINELLNAYSDGKIISGSNTTTIDIKNKVDRYNQLMEIINSEAYNNWYYDNYGAGSLLSTTDTSSEFYHMKQEFDSLNNELIKLANQKGVTKAELLSSISVHNSNTTLQNKGAENINPDEELALFGENSIFGKIFNPRQGMINLDVTPAQQELINQINSYIMHGQSCVVTFNSTTEISSAMLDKITDLSMVSIQLLDGLGDGNGSLKSKYLSNPKYEDRITYNGFEMKAIVGKIEELQAKIDINLPIAQRAKQVYEVLATEIPPMYDFNKYSDGHKVSASLRGITEYNSVGKVGLVCAGYASVFKELCERVGIQCDYVRGGTKLDPLTGRNNGNHAWNVVYSEEGMIPVDVTWHACGNGDGEWFGTSDAFIDSHFSDFDERAQNYSNMVSNIMFKSSREKLNKILSVLDNKYHDRNETLRRLNYYLTTFDSSKITRTDGAREMISSLDYETIRNFVYEVECNTKISDAIRIMDQKQGQSGYGILVLKDYLNTHDPTHITRTGNARSTIMSLSFEDIYKYLYGG